MMPPEFERLADALVEAFSFDKEQRPFQLQVTPDLYLAIRFHAEEFGRKLDAALAELEPIELPIVVKYDGHLIARNEDNLNSDGFKLVYRDPLRRRPA